MSWPGFINRILESTNKVDKVAIFNSDGVPLAVTEDISVSKLEGEAILRSLYDPSHSIALIHIDDVAYTCFQGNESTLLGNNKSKGMTFVAYLAKECVILVLGRSEGHGSFLFELKRNLYMWEKNQKQEHATQRKIRPIPDGESNSNTILHQPQNPNIQSDALLNIEEPPFPNPPFESQQTLSDGDILLDLSNQQQQQILFD